MNSRTNFSSKLGMVLAAAGSAVGLGNIWRFPAEVGNNGGAAFLIVYVLCILLVGVPVMVSEFVIGRHTHANTITAFRKLAPGTWWRIGGVEGVLVAFVILSYYIVVSGWTLHYTVASLANQLSADRDYGQYFSSFTSHAWQPILYALVFMGMTHWVVVRGVQSGIERFSKVMMPMLLLIIGVLVVCSFSMSGFTEGMHFLLHPDFSKLSASMLLSAVGQAFFSLSLAMGCLCTYASYFGPETNLAKTALSVVAIDTLVAVLAGFIIFPAVFTVGVHPDQGAGLVFITLPSVFTLAFGHVPLLGWFFSSLFYVLLMLAALTSAISLHEPVTAYLHEEWHVSRRKAAWLVTLSCSALGVLCSLSMGPLSDYPIFGMTLFDLFDFLSAKIVMPLGGVLICLFVGWRMDSTIVRAEVTNSDTLLGTPQTCRTHHLRLLAFRLYLFLIRWVAPLAILSIFVQGLVA